MKKFKINKLVRLYQRLINKPRKEKHMDQQFFGVERRANRLERDRTLDLSQVVVANKLHREGIKLHPQTVVSRTH